MRVRSLCILLLALLIPSASSWGFERSPLKPEPNSFFLRVIDTGSGTATLSVITGQSNRSRKVLIYDVGHWNDDPLIIRELKHYLGRRKTVDVMIISHSDSDHLGAADSVLDFWNVKKAVRTGYERPRSTGTYWKVRRSLEKSVADKGTEDFVIGDGSPALGESWDLGEARITFLSGFSELPSGWDVGVSPGHSRFKSKARNAISVVVRVDYDGRSILLTGDGVGRTDGSPSSQIIGTEKFLVDNSQTRPIRADIILAPHHGADNASSLPFIEKVKPSWVIFSAGTKYAHPKFNTFRRYEDFGVPVAQILRTDRGDEKGRPTEWWGDWDDSCRDGHGDDGVSILIRKSGPIEVDQDAPEDENLGC